MIEWLRFIFSIASRHLLGKKKQTLLVITGVTIGSMVMIVTLALGEGIVQDIQDKIIEISPYIVVKGEKEIGKEHLLFDTLKPATSYSIHSRIRPDEKKEIKPYMEIVSIIDSIPMVDGVSPFVLTKGVMRLRTVSKQGIIKGIVPARESSIAHLEKNIVTGSLNELNFTKDGILLGSGMAKKLKATYHDIISITGESGKMLSVRVVGTFASGFSAVDDNNAFVNLSLAQLLNGISENVVTGIGVHTRELDVVNSTSVMIRRLTGYKTETWEETNENVITLFKRNNGITLFLVLFVFIVSGFGIANVLITIVLQKQPDIAIMKSIGVSGKSIQMIFLTEGLLLGIIGAAVGALAGYLVANLIGSLPVSYGENAVVRSDHIAIVQRSYFFILTTVFSVLISAISAYGPARRAARLKPVEILKA